MQKYRVSGRIPFFGLIAMVIGAVVTGVLFGGALFLAERLLSMYLICVFPLAACLLGGAVFGWFVRVGKVRSPIVAGLLAIIAGLAIIGAYRGLSYYVGYREDVRQLAIDEGVEVTPAELDELADYILEESTGTTGFVGFIRFSAQQGYDISYRSADIHLDETQTWIYWGVEAVVILLVIAYLGMNAAGSPFDESTGRWFGKTSELIGIVAWNTRQQFYDAMQAADYRTASRFIVDVLPLPHVRVIYQTSTSESQQFYVEVCEVQAQRNNQTNSVTKLNGILSDNELRLLQSEVKANSERLQQTQASSASSPISSAARR